MGIFVYISNVIKLSEMKKEIELEHPFILHSHNIDELLKGTQKLATFCNKLEKQSLLHPNRYPINDYTGDGFEFLSEGIYKLFPVDNRLGMSNYRITPPMTPGVDGFGIGIDGKPATSQSKYKSDSRWLLTANEDHLSNFTSLSMMKYGVDPLSKTNMIVITTANDLHFYTKDIMFLNRVRCIGYEDLRGLLDNNIPFWNNLRELVNEIIKNIK